MGLGDELRHRREPRSACLQVREMARPAPPRVDRSGLPLKADEPAGAKEIGCVAGARVVGVAIGKRAVGDRVGVGEQLPGADGVALE